MAGQNQFGLSRDIPDEIRREVRKACGFGCVICGASIVEYEHVDPEFGEAMRHDPEAIALLCPSCHAKVTRKFWSKDKVKGALAAPFCKRSGFSWGAFDFGPRPPSVRFSGVLLTNCPIPVEVAGAPLFQIQEPEESGAPFRLSATFADSHGSRVLQIDQNEWQVNSGAWDAEFVGGKIVIRQSPGEHCLILRAEPPHGIAVERLCMAVGSYYFEGDEQSFDVFRFVQGQPRLLGRFSGGIIDHCRVGISFG